MAATIISIIGLFVSAIGMIVLPVVFFFYTARINQKVKQNSDAINDVLNLLLDLGIKTSSTERNKIRKINSNWLKAFIDFVNYFLVNKSNSQNDAFMIYFFSKIIKFKIYKNNDLTLQDLKQLKDIPIPMCEIFKNLQRFILKKDSGEYYIFSDLLKYILKNDNDTFKDIISTFMDNQYRFIFVTKKDKILISKSRTRKVYRKNNEIDLNKVLPLSDKSIILYKIFNLKQKINKNINNNLSWINHSPVYKSLISTQIQEHKLNFKQNEQSNKTVFINLN